MSTYNWDEIRNIVLFSGVNQVGRPSAEDLDAVAEEQRIKSLPLPQSEAMKEYFAFAVQMAREAARKK